MLREFKTRRKQVDHKLSRIKSRYKIKGSSSLCIAIKEAINEAALIGIIAERERILSGGDLLVSRDRIIETSVDEVLDIVRDKP